MKDLSNHVVFLNNMAKGGLPAMTVMGTMHEVGYWEGAIEADTPCNPQSQYGIAKNALRQSLMLSLKDTGCHLHWLRAYYITGGRGPRQFHLRQDHPGGDRRQGHLPLHQRKESL